MDGWPVFGVLTVWPAIGTAALAAVVLAYHEARFWVFVTAALLILYVSGAPVWALGVAVGLLVVRLFRLWLISIPIMRIMDRLKLLPRISDTEQAAIEAGEVWIEGELFSGRPDWKRILSAPYPQLTESEQAFLDGPVDALCAAVDDWQVWADRAFPEPVWDFIRKERLFGMIIPPQYGGLGFSAMANSAVVAKLQSRCNPLATTVMVPNSLGPAELLLHYGTQAQRDHYLPRLADASAIPAFALTEPKAGSDAGALEAEGVLFRDEDGAIMIRLNWDKRYITLSATAHVLGLAFKLRDPDHLLGNATELGITCALIPGDTPGIIRGQRHDPLGVPFVNAPFSGRDVIVPLDAIIGGVDGAGQGWRMLMESLAAGRGISLPASAVGSAKLIFLVASAHAAIREQFGVPIGKFEGIEEPLARIGGFTYLMDAARIYTLGAIDSGIAPPVVTAMVKYNLTELGRRIVMDGMDILAGNAISVGPRNLVAHTYLSNPIAITVEGANILTRTLIVFGQGAIRCHPWAYPEITALAARDAKGFDRAFFGHIGHMLGSLARCLVLGLTRGFLAPRAGRGVARRYVRRLTWASASFACMAEVAMVALGGELKRKEKLTGRFADIFSWMYLGAATIRRFEAEGHRKEDEPYFRWSMDFALGEIQRGFVGLLDNLRVPGCTWLLRGPVGLYHRINGFGRGPSDRLGHRVARQMQADRGQRSRIAAGTYIPTDTSEALGRLEHAFKLVTEARRVDRKVSKAVRAGQLQRRPRTTRVQRAFDAGLITEAEAELKAAAIQAAEDAIQVDAFDQQTYTRHHGTTACVPANR